MAKALIFADLHLHSHKESVDRLHDCLAVLDWIFAVAEEQGCEHLIFLGDLFHERARIDVLNYLRTFEVFMKHMITRKSPIKVWLLIGNHDMYHKERWDVNSVKPLGALPNVEIIDRPMMVNIGGLDIDFCPHSENPPLDLDVLRQGTAQILMGHMAVDGATLNRLYGTKSDVIVEYDNDMVSVGPALFAHWKKVLLGHYHGAQLIGNVEYVGSPLQLSFGEAFEQKHVILFDLETLEQKYIVNDFSPKHFIITPDDIPNHQMKGGFVRIVVSDIGSKDLIDLQNQVVKNYQVASLDFKERERKEEDEKIIIDDAKSLLINEDEMIDTFVDANGVPDGLDGDRLKKTGKWLCSLAK